MAEYRLQLQRRWTDNADELVAECNQIRAAMQSYGFHVIGYDPGVLVTDLETKSAPAADIPLWMLKKLMAKEPTHG